LAFVAAFLGLGILACLFFPKTYQSTGMIQVAKDGADALGLENTINGSAASGPEASLSGTTPGQRYTAITFDDGHRSVSENALPVMRERRIACAIFFITELLGKPAPWAGLKGYEIHDTYLTEDELKRLDESMVIVGSHTTSHERLPSLSKSERLKQFLDSRACLESLTGRPVRLFAFPFGTQSQDCITESTQSGYERVFTVEPTVGFKRPNEFVCGRIVVDPDDWRVEFILKLTGAYNWRSPVFALRDKVRLAFGRKDRITVGKAESICIESSMLELTEKDSILVPN
jgi:peptidoglycan/xylan/chitin deacetylase (PgdA/CDA1 family)